MLIATTWKRGPPSRACKPSSAGISLRQGTHQVAHRLSNTARPRHSPSVLLSPEPSRNARSKTRPPRIPRRVRPPLPPPRRARIESADACARPAVLHRVDRSSAQPINGRAMSNKMWGGRFGSEPDAIMQEINASIGIDRALYAQDIAASKAHAEMLAQQGILSREDAGKIAQGLDTIRAEIESGKFS